MKKFWQTSEFWVTLVTNLAGIAVLTGAITSTQADQIKNAVQQIIGGVIALVPIITYIISRTSLKKAVIDNMPAVPQIFDDPANMKLSADVKPKTSHELYAEALKQAGV